MLTSQSFIGSHIANAVPGSKDFKSPVEKFLQIPADLKRFRIFGASGFTLDNSQKQ